MLNNQRLYERTMHSLDNTHNKMVTQLLALGAQLKEAKILLHTLQRNYKTLAKK